MRKSKYVGQKFGDWTVTAIFLANNYSHGTRHNAYRYQLKRITSDNKCLKTITVSGSTMLKIAKSEKDIEAIVANKKKTQTTVNEVLYQFN